MVFLFSGAALALCVPTFGAFLFLACWLPVRSSWVGFGLAGSGRAALDQGSFWLFFWVASLAPEMVTWILPKCTKTNGFGAIYAQRAARRIVACEPLCSESSCFLECFCEFWWAPFGTKWALWCEFDSFARRFQCFARTPFWSRFGLLCELQALLALWRPELVAGP